MQNSGLKKAKNSGTIKSVILFVDFYNPIAITATKFDRPKVVLIDSISEKY